MEGLSGKGRDWVLGVRDWGFGVGKERYWTTAMIPTSSNTPIRTKRRINHGRCAEGKEHLAAGVEGHSGRASLRLGARG